MGPRFCILGAPSAVCVHAGGSWGRICGLLGPFGCLEPVLPHCCSLFRTKTMRNNSGWGLIFASWGLPGPYACIPGAPGAVSVASWGHLDVLSPCTRIVAHCFAPKQCATMRDGASFLHPGCSQGRMRASRGLLGPYLWPPGAIWVS